MADRHDQELIEELRELGRWLQPPTPDLTAAVCSRLSARRASGRPFAAVPRRWWATATAVVLALAIALVPQGRAAVAHAVNDLLRFAGIEIRYGQPAPLTSPSPLPAIRSAQLDDARRRAHFPVRVPTLLGVPEQVQVADPGPDGAPRIVSLLYRGGSVRLDEFDGQLDVAFLKTSTTTESRWLDLPGTTGMWFPTPHSVTYIDRQGVPHRETARLAASTLIWSDTVVTYRLEGVSTFEEASRIAATVH